MKTFNFYDWVTCLFLVLAFVDSDKTSLHHHITLAWMSMIMSGISDIKKAIEPPNAKQVAENIKSAFKASQQKAGVE